MVGAYSPRRQSEWTKKGNRLLLGVLNWERHRLRRNCFLFSWNKGRRGGSHLIAASQAHNKTSLGLTIHEGGGRRVAPCSMAERW